MTSINGRNIALTIITIMILYILVHDSSIDFHNFSLVDKAIAQSDQREFSVPKSWGKLLQYVEQKGEDSKWIFQSEDGTIRIITTDFLGGDSKFVETIKRK
jgi:hypothetical protein